MLPTIESVLYILVSFEPKVFLLLSKQGVYLLHARRFMLKFWWLHYRRWKTQNVATQLYPKANPQNMYLELTIQHQEASELSKHREAKLLLR